MNNQSGQFDLSNCPDNFYGALQSLLHCRATIFPESGRSTFRLVLWIDTFVLYSPEPARKITNTV